MGLKLMEEANIAYFLNKTGYKNTSVQISVSLYPSTAGAQNFRPIVMKLDRGTPKNNVA